MIDIELIRDLTDAFGPSGFEEDVVEVIKEYKGDLELETDHMNNVFASLKSNKGGRIKILLDAHTDEVGFMVQSILENGLISFMALGGWVNSNIPAHLVKIKNTRGEYIEGITTSKPPHFMNDEERASDKLDIETMYIDVGASSRDEVINYYGIELGDPVAPLVDFKYDEGSQILRGKAFDNRLGCACILETMKRLGDNQDLQVDVIGGFASQEEVGMRGARVSSQRVQPDLAIVFEGSPADDVYYDKRIAQGVLKKGVQIRHMDSSYISSPTFIAYAKELADRDGIKYQAAVRRLGGTNAGAIHVQGQGVPVLVLGIPSRYVHTHYNYCALEDIEATINLAVEVIENLNKESIDRILKRG